MSLSFCVPVADHLAAAKPLHVAVAVSGGSDSLALAHFLKCWSDRESVTLTALIVDHQLRPESSEEARHVRGLLNTIGIHSEILEWKGEKPRTAVQEKARDIRYALIEQWCIAHHVQHLFLGHHLDDQFETFLMRLSRGQGPYSLSSMQQVSQRGSLTILRPFLHHPKKVLRDYLQEFNVTWVEDPSNGSLKFERVRTRALCCDLYTKGLDHAMVSELMATLTAVRDLVDLKSKLMFEACVSFSNEREIHLDPQYLKHDEVTLRCLRMIIYTVRGKDVDINTEKLHNLLDILKDRKFKNVTMGGCLFTYTKGKVIVLRENRKQVILNEK